jgi:WD40 repeat protein
MRATLLKYSTSRRRVPALALALLALVLPSAAGNAQEHPKLEIVPNIAHALGITSLAVSPDGAHLLSGSSVTSIKLWER